MYFGPRARYARFVLSFFRRSWFGKTRLRSIVACYVFVEQLHSERSRSTKKRTSWLFGVALVPISVGVSHLRLGYTTISSACYIEKYPLVPWDFGQKKFAICSSREEAS